MRVQDIMNDQVELVSAGETAEAVRQKMKARRIHHLVVVDSGRVVGILSERDLRGPIAAGNGGASTAGDLMTPHVVSAKPATTIREAANLLRGHTIGCLPVFDGKKLVGIITVSDLLELVGRGSERLAERADRWTLKNRGPRRRAGSRN